MRPLHAPLPTPIPVPGPRAGRRVLARAALRALVAVAVLAAAAYSLGVRRVVVVVEGAARGVTLEITAGAVRQPPAPAPPVVRFVTPPRRSTAASPA